MGSEESKAESLIGKLGSIVLLYAPNSAGGANLKYFNERTSQIIDLATTAIYNSPLSMKYMLVEEFAEMAVNFLDLPWENTPKGRVVEYFTEEKDAKSEAINHIKRLGESAIARLRVSRDLETKTTQTFFGDAPFCDTCGHITVRNGACFKCLNCGSSMGCS